MTHSLVPVAGKNRDQRCIGPGSLKQPGPMAPCYLTPSLFFFPILTHARRFSSTSRSKKGAAHQRRQAAPPPTPRAAPPPPRRGRPPPRTRHDVAGLLPAQPRARPDAPASSPHVRRPDAGLTPPSSPRTPPVPPRRRPRAQRHRRPTAARTGRFSIGELEF